MTMLERVNRHLGDPEVFVRRVASALVANGLSQAALARAAEVNESNLCRYLNLRARPSMETMLRLDDALERLTHGA